MPLKRTSDDRSGFVIRSQPNIQKTIQASRRATTPSTQLRAQTPQPILSDVTLRYCDKRLMEMQAEVVERLEQRRKLSITPPPFSSSKRGASSAAVATVVDVEQLPVKDGEEEATPVSPVDAEVPSQGLLRAVDVAPPQQSGVVVVAQTSPTSEGVAPPPSHEIPTVANKRTKKRVTEEAQVQFPPEVIAEYIPGVTSALLEDAARRHKRAQRRRKDYIKLQKYQRKPVANEHELFPELVTDIAREEDVDDTLEKNKMTNASKESVSPTSAAAAVSMGNEGGVESPRVSPAPILFTTPQKFDFSPQRYRQLQVAEQTVSPPTSPCQDPQEDQSGAVKVHRMPETAEYQHMIRMQRAQQTQWKQQPRVWDLGMVREKQPTAKRLADTMSGSHQPFLSQSSMDLQSSEQFSNSENAPFSPLAATSPIPRLNFDFTGKGKQATPLVPRLMLPLVLPSMGGAPNAVVDASRGLVIPKLNIPSIARAEDSSHGGVSPTSVVAELTSSCESQALRPRVMALSSRSEAETAVSSSELVPLIARRGTSAGGGGHMSDAMSPVPSTQHTRSVARGHVHSSDDDDDDEDVDALRQQFADFLKQTGNHHDSKGHPDDDDDDDAKANVRPFVLPNTFVRYSMSNIRSASTSGTLQRNANLKRMDSLIDDSDRSTSYFSKTVKIIWGSSTPDAEPSSIARTAPCRLVVELSFRPGRHHFDARHLYQLMDPYAEYVLDLEAGNRGGKLLAVYGYSELQCLKAIAAMMSRVRGGESYLLADCYCAPSPNQAHEMLLESPRDEDIEEDDRLPATQHSSKRKRKGRRGSEVVSFVGSPDVLDPTDGDDHTQDEENDLDDDESVPDSMAWFKRHATVIDTAVVNHHAPGAVQQFIAAVEKQKRQKIQKSKRMKKRKSSSIALASALSGAAASGGDGSGSFVPPPPDADEVEVEKDLTLFIAEGDEVKGLEGIDLTVTVVEDEPEEDDVEEIDNPLGRTMSKVKKVQSIFSIKEMEDDDVQKALENNTWSIMELVARSKYSPEELRRMKSHAVAQKRATLTKAQLHKMERMQQNAMTSLKEFRDAKQSADDDGASSTTSKKSQRKPRKRNAKALHAKRKKKIADEETHNNSPNRAAMEAAKSQTIEGEQQAPDASSTSEKAKSDENIHLSVDIGVAMSESIIISPSHEGELLHSMDSQLLVVTTEDPSPEAMSRQKRQEVDDAEALALFAEFLQQYATSEKVAVIVPICSYEDPSLLPVPNAESDAEDLIFLLHQVDYDIVVMAPPTALVAPGPDATQEELDEYNDQVEFDRKRWFLTPSAENISEVTECLLRQNQGGKYCCVSLFLITRGFTGTLARRVSYPYERSDHLIALTMDSDTNDLNTENTINPRTLAHRMKKATGKVPMIFVDTYPLPDIPNSDSYAVYLNALTAPPPQSSNFGRFAQVQQPTGAPQRVPAPSFLSFTAQPEDGGSELLCQYPKHAGGLGTYYFKRALEGRACPPKSLVATMSNMIWFLSAKLQKRGCKIQHNAVVPKGYSSLRPYFDLSTVYDSAYEMQRNLAAAHVVEVTSGARIHVNCRVQLDQSMYVTESDSFLFAHEYWTRQFRRDLHKILYPKKHDQQPMLTQSGGKGGKSGGGKQQQPIIKPRPEKAMRLRCILCRCVSDNLVVQYPDCADLLFDEKRFRAVERDVGRIAEKCDVIQQEEPHGFAFAHGLHLLSQASGAATNRAGGGGQRPVELVRGSKAQRNSTLDFDARRFSCQDLNLKLMKEYVRSRAPHTSIPLSLRPFLPSGFIKLQFFGLRKRLQQDFAMNYLISGCQRVTIPGTSLVSLFKRPSMLWGEIAVDFVGNRRDLRKVDRLMRQQALNARGGDSIMLLRVELDLYETTEHIAAQSIQRIFRGHLVRRVLKDQRHYSNEESLAREELREEERAAWYHLMLQFYGIYKRMLEAFEDRNRFDMYFEEQENRWYLIVEARRLLQAAYDRGRARIMTEEGLDSMPLLADVVALHLAAAEAFDYAWIMAFHWHIHGSAWDRYYLEMDVYQEILRVRNVFRDETALERYQLGYLMEHPTPPSTMLDSGRSIIRGIQEERARKDRKRVKERLQQAAEQARQRQREEEEYAERQRLEMGTMEEAEEETELPVHHENEHHHQQEVIPVVVAESSSDAEVLPPAG
ncbi:Hypothetical protein, putative [Bodo saltans]|uniref:Uncharacterized protein n=1 Tax=Bodo saltans TaxID=75058 RepID=A0A0S4J9Q3_BODSA|nr:Hypothetical protein, putative [Bodo saltans]|eukprot:CUG86862.1 Hypothetical protein, putative [Bodo saltans]